MNVQLASPKCTYAEVCNPRTSAQKICVLMTWGLHIFTLEKVFAQMCKWVFSVECAEVQWGLYLESTLCIAASHKARRGLEKLSVCLLPHQSSTEECPQLVARGFHINRAPEHSGGGGEVGTRKRRWCQESWRVFSLQRSRSVWMVWMLGQVHYALMTRLLGRLLFYQKLKEPSIEQETLYVGLRFLNIFIFVVFYLPMPDYNAISMGLLVIVLTYHHWVMPVL